MTLNNKRIIKALSLGIVSLGVLVGLGLSTNSSSNAHANTDEQNMDQDIAETEASNKNFNRDAENGSIETTLELKNDKNYPIDVVGMLNTFPDLEHSAIMNKMISYLSPKGREQFNEYYFNNSSTDAGGNLHESPDAAAGLYYDPNNSADNYLPLKGQHYISTTQEKKLQNPPLFSNDDSEAKPKKHTKRIARHAKRAKKATKARKKRTKKVNKRRHVKKSTKRIKKVRKHAKHSIRKTRRPKKARRARKSHKMSALAKRKLQERYNKLGTYAQGKAQAKRDFTKDDIFKALIKNRKILSNNYYHGYDHEMSDKSFDDDDGDSYTSTISPAIDNARNYWKGNKLVKKAIYDYYEHNQQPNSKLMNNHQYKNAFENASLMANGGD